MLEIGFGPGLLVEHVSRLAPKGRVVGIDHCALMFHQASRRNRPAIEAGLIELKLGGLELVPRLSETFDKAFSVNVLQFLSDRVDALKMIRSVLKPGGLLAKTYQPRHRGARPEDAKVFALTLSKQMIDVGFREVGIKELDLKPMPVICVIGRN